MTADLRVVQLTSAGQPSLQLEGRWHLPAGRGLFPAAVIAHPHPLWGGSMHNNVVGRIARALAARGWAALRFNFRGVGSSHPSQVIIYLPSSLRGDLLPQLLPQIVSFIGVIHAPSVLEKEEQAILRDLCQTQAICLG